MTGCEQGFHVLRDPLYSRWQIGYVCWRCGKRKWGGKGARRRFNKK